MIGIQGIVKSYGRQTVLQGIDWQVQRGDFWGIIGPNGSGKTTLLNVLSGVEGPETGEITLDGRLLASYSRKELSRKLAVLQQDGLPPMAFPVRQVLEMGRFPFQNWRGKEEEDGAERLINEIMRRLDLLGLEHKPLHVLSGGQRQRVALGKVMAQQPEVVLLDEPTTYLDIRYQMQFMELVSSWQRAEHLTVIAVMHDLNLASLYCDKLIALRDGKIIASGTPNEIITPEIVKMLFDVDAYSVMHPDRGVPQLLLRSEQGM
ncbi:ABC transporter ATP-binding protein [Paenibacillus ihumii]|uniref:ABC transporter ATP-binding protein n=1 Tax=Paenibacillus ihumii TaxID=687436 RepID=UPI0006D7CD21|nr:ABC transporter ATP-binding protein [Paenibacillus ihumii]